MLARFGVRPVRVSSNQRPQRREAMTIKEGDVLPSETLRVLGDDGNPAGLRTDDYFAGKRVVMFGVPGAFTRTCSSRHLPGFVQYAEVIKGRGVDEIICLAVNDAAVMNAWGEAHGVQGKITMLSDGNADLTRAMGMDIDRHASGMGVRSRRYAMILDDGIVRKLNVEPDGGYGASSAEKILEDL